MQRQVLNHFKAQDPHIYSLLVSSGKDILLTTSTDFLYSLVESIISQQLSVKAGNTIVSRFVSLFPNKAVTAKNILQIEGQKMREAGLSWSKVSYVKNIAEAVNTGTLNFQQLEKLSDEEVIVMLTKIKGVGPWTAEMFLIFAMGRQDIFSFGDIGLQNAVQKVYKLPTKPTKAQMEKITLSWKPYRTYASLALWNSLDNSDL